MGDEPVVALTVSRECSAAECGQQHGDVAALPDEISHSNDASSRPIRHRPAVVYHSAISAQHHTPLT